jgi:uncharacterized iron-regulated membrane protein
MKTKTIWKIHSWLGLLTGIPLLVIAFTGSILVFKDELNAWLIPERFVIEAPSGARELPLKERLKVVQSELPEHEITGWAFYEAPHRADFVYVVAHGDNEWLHVYQNPYTGELLSQPGATESELMGWVLMLHYTFLAGHIGMAICGILAVLLCLLGISGFLVYRKFWKSFFTFRWRTSLRLISGNLHKRIGIISGPVFLILGITGAWWNLEHVVQEVAHWAEGEEHEPVMERRLYATGLPLDAMAAEASRKIPEFNINYISFPWEPDLPVTFYGSFEGQNPFRSPYHSTVTFEAQNGAYQSHHRIDEAKIGAQVYDAFEPLHFGTFGGWVSRILWCVLGSAPGFLALSGFIVWWKRP